MTGEVNENCPLLGCYATRSGNSLPTFREQPIGRIFEKYRYMGTVCCSETSAGKYRDSLCNSPEERSSDWLDVCSGVKRRVTKRWSTVSTATSGVCPLHKMTRCCPPAVWSVWGEPSSDHAVPIAPAYIGSNMVAATQAVSLYPNVLQLYILSILCTELLVLFWNKKGNAAPGKCPKIQRIFRCVIEEIPAEISVDHSAFIFRAEQPFLVCLTEKCEGTLTLTKRRSVSPQKTVSPASQLRGRNWTFVL